MDEQKAAAENKKGEGAAFRVEDLPGEFRGVPAGSFRLARMVSEAQKDHGLPVSGIIDAATLEALGKPKPAAKPKKSKKKPAKKDPKEAAEEMAGVSSV